MYWAPRRTASVVDHLIDGHREGILMPIQRHAQTIADTDDIDTGTFRPRRAQHFADCDHDEPFAGCFLRRQVRDC